MGRTIVNSQTGETRISATGETVQEYHARLERIAEERKKMDERDQWSTFATDTPPFPTANGQPGRITLYEFEAAHGGTAAAVTTSRTERNALRARLRSLDDAALRQEIAKLNANGDAQFAEIAEAIVAMRARETRKVEIFNELRDFAAAHVSVHDADGYGYLDSLWRAATKPLRISDKLTEAEAKELLDTLGKITGFEKYRSNVEFRNAIQWVREYQTPLRDDNAKWWLTDDEVLDEHAETNPSDSAK